MHPTTTTVALLLLTIVAAAAAAALSSTTHAASLPPRRLAAAGANVTAAGASCSPKERDALLAFKRGITADPAGHLASWRHDGDDHQDCCRWRGVRCSDWTGHVVGLRLRNMDFKQEDYDYTDYQETALVGEISPSLLNLPYLKHLDLSLNALHGPTGRVPEFLGSLKSLRYLNLSGIEFSGRVPPQLGNLTNLHYLDLSVCRGSDAQYSTDLSWLARLRSLTYLDMSYTDLSKVHDWAHVVNNIPSLKVLYLAYCNLVYANHSLSPFNLTNLEELDLSLNNFDHPFASCWFWNAKRLTNLNLQLTGLYGRIPNALEDFKSLQILDLSFTSIMDTMTANMTNLCNLRILHLESSQIHGDIAELLERLPQCSFTGLNELHLSENNITGMLPNHLDHLTSLAILDISENKLSGPVHPKIGTFSNLTYFDLSSNNLDGVITDEHFASLTILKTLSLSGNSLRILVDSEWLPPFSLEVALLSSCHMGSLFPKWLKWQVNITYLDISSAGITDRFPIWFATTFLNTRFLDVSNNGISGSLPANMEVMTKLSILKLDSNKLTGQIPMLPKGLEIMDISRNLLSGPLPSNFGGLSLYILRLFSNRITGHIPKSMCELQDLDILDLAENFLEGEFPKCFQSLHFRMLFASNNMLSGKFPPFLRSSKSLYILDLASNYFYGGLPMWIGELSQLEIVRLSDNNFSGNIPTTITNLTYLVHLDLARNCISGVLPLHLSNLTGMKSGGRGMPVVRYAFIPRAFQAHFPVLNVSVDTKGQKRYYGRFAAFDMVTIDLSLNYLTGEIPEVIAFLDRINNLNLSWNQFSGRIPSNIGAMRSLESLDLSENNLSGEIPSSISNLTYLSRLDLSYNHLTGRIPSGGQLDTLYAENPSMYNGNNGLCGYPLQKKCSDISNVPKHGVERKTRRDYEPMLYFGLGSGFVVGLWVVFCTILFKKAWRIAYFRLFDELYDKVHVFVVISWATLLGTR
uniref:non-specific serine/threonine protein kinase n=1 Tax=Oryza punctata TaxID=4537 RepID=A0A0E0MGE0_ORYPU